MKFGDAAPATLFSQKPPDFDNQNGEEDSTFLSMALRSIILRNSFDDVKGNVVVIRAFQLSDTEGLILTGNDFDDHELWLLDNDAAELLGTLTEESYKHLRRSKNLLLFVGNSNFNWVNLDSRRDSTLTGKFVSSSMLRDAYTYTQAYER